MPASSVPATWIRLVLDTPGVGSWKNLVRGQHNSRRLVLNRVFLPAIVAQGSGTVIYITSGAAYHRPPAKAGEGGWGLGSYAMSKAAGTLSPG